MLEFILKVPQKLNGLIGSDFGNLVIDVDYFDFGETRLWASGESLPVLVSISVL